MRRYLNQILNHLRDTSPRCRLRIDHEQVFRWLRTFTACFTFLPAFVIGAGMMRWRGETWQERLATTLLHHRCNQFLWRECRLPIEEYLEWLESQVQDEA